MEGTADSRRRLSRRPACGRPPSGLELGYETLAEETDTRPRSESGGAQRRSLREINSKEFPPRSPRRSPSCRVEVQSDGPSSPAAFGKTPPRQNKPKFSLRAETGPCGGRPGFSASAVHCGIVAGTVEPCSLPRNPLRQWLPRFRVLRLKSVPGLFKGKLNATKGGKASAERVHRSETPLRRRGRVSDPPAIRPRRSSSASEAPCHSFNSPRRLEQISPCNSALFLRVRLALFQRREETPRGARPSPSFPFSPSSLPFRRTRKAFLSKLPATPLLR